MGFPGGDVPLVVSIGAAGVLLVGAVVLMIATVRMLMNGFTSAVSRGGLHRELRLATELGLYGRASR